MSKTQPSHTPARSRGRTGTAAKSKPLSSDPETLVWGRRLEQKRYLKVPKILFKLARYNDRVGGKQGPIFPRHILLLLTLAACKYRDRPIRLYWQELGDHMGVSWETARKWAYQAEAEGLIKIRRHRGRNKETDRVGYRNERNSFDISPVIPLLEQADDEWQRRRKASRSSRPDEGAGDE